MVSKIKGCIHGIYHAFSDSWKNSGIILLTTTIGIFALRGVARAFRPIWGESCRDMIGRQFLRNRKIRSRYTSNVNAQRKKFAEKIKGNWSEFGKPIVTLPEKGFDELTLVSLILGYEKSVIKHTKDVHFSGTVYSPGLRKEDDYQMDVNATNGPKDEYEKLQNKLRKIFTYAFERSYLWNSMHSDEFGVAGFISYQVVRMVAAMYGGSEHDVMGHVTSGGTESLMVAVRGYCMWGILNKGHQPGEGVIITGDTIHAGVLKGVCANYMNVVQVKTDEDGQIDLKALNKAVRKHGKKVVAIFASTPTYGVGHIDNVHEIALIAKKNGCGLHVDSCLGGFVVNFLDEYDTNYLKIDGVTSLSCDNHKNGLAPKGVATLVTRRLGSQNLLYYASYIHPYWESPYGSISFSGSTPVTPMLTALLSMLAIGKNKYKEFARKIYGAVKSLKGRIEKDLKDKIRIIGKTPVNVLAFKVDEKLGLSQGASYALLAEMKKRGFVLNDMKGDRVHLCVTGRFIADKNALDNFFKALNESVDAVVDLDLKNSKAGTSFPGKASMYCSLAEAESPKKKEMAWDDYFENYFFGNLAAHDLVWQHFEAMMDPYIE